MSMLPQSTWLLARALDLALIVLFPVVAALAIPALPYLLVRRWYVLLDAFIDTLEETSA